MVIFAPYIATRMYLHFLLAMIVLVTNNIVVIDIHIQINMHASRTPYYCIAQNFGGVNFWWMKPEYAFE